MASASPHSPGHGIEAHRRGWAYLWRIRSRFDVALLQEAGIPDDWAPGVWRGTRYVRASDRRPNGPGLSTAA